MGLYVNSYRFQEYPGAGLGTVGLYNYGANFLGNSAGETKLGA